MSDTLYEKSNTGDDSWAFWYGANWEGQTFTPSVTHTITSVKLYLYRDDGAFPGTITVSIRATSASLPTGADLASGTYNGDSMTPSVPTWYEFTLGAGTLLTASTKYAIVVRAPTGDISNQAKSRVTNPGTYASGSAVYSGNSGATWADYGTFDYQFEEYGIAIGSTGIIAIVGTRLHYLDAYGQERHLLGVPISQPTVFTFVTSSITDTTATGNGYILSIGDDSVTQHGHCWGASPNPTTSDSKTTNGAGSVGGFTSAITGLTTKTDYHTRAYATNSYGTVYGSDIMFTTI